MASRPWSKRGPNAGAAGGTDLDVLRAVGDVGAQQRALQQEGINRQMARYQYDANKGQQQLGNYMNMISGNYGGTVQKTTPGQSPLSSIASLVSAFKGF